MSRLCFLWFHMLVLLQFNGSTLLFSMPVYMKMKHLVHKHTMRWYANRSTHGIAIHKSNISLYVSHKAGRASKARSILCSAVLVGSVMVTTEEEREGSLSTGAGLILMMVALPAGNSFTILSKWTLNFVNIRKDEEMCELAIKRNISGERRDLWQPHAYTYL